MTAIPQSMWGEFSAHRTDRVGPLEKASVRRHNLDNHDATPTAAWWGSAKHFFHKLCAGGTSCVNASDGAQIQQDLHLNKSNDLTPSEQTGQTAAEVVAAEPLCTQAGNGKISQTPGT